MVADPLGIKVIRAYGLNKAWLIGFLMDIFGALLMLRALSLAPVIRAYALNKAWLIGFLMDIFGALLMLRALSLAPLMVCHILEMGLSLRTAEEIFRDYSARRTDVVHTLINGTVSSKILRRSSYSNRFSEKYMYIKKPPNLQRKQQNLKEKSQERNSGGLKIAVTESLSCSSSSPPPTKHPGEIEGQ